MFTIRVDYPGSKWKRERKEWCKLHTVISIHDISVMAFSITDDHAHDAKEGMKILESIREGIRRIFGHNRYDSKSIFNSLGWNAIIPPGKNASS